MRLRRVDIRNFRKLVDGVSIGDLPAGLSVISGDNEEGKSTVLAAIQAALFEKHSVGGETAASLLPYGAKVRPEVALAFDIDDRSYRLEKGFCSKPAVRLTTPDAPFEGDAAEEKLQEILGFTPPGRGGAKPEHRGLSGLLWVEQGQSFAPLPLHDDSRTTLLDALEGEVGTLVGGDRGRHLIQAVELRRSVLLTATGKPKDDYRRTGEEIAQVTESLERVQAELRSHEQRVDQLQRAVEDKAKDDADDVLNAAQKRFEQAEQAWRAVSEIEEKLTAATARLADAKVAAQHAVGARTSRQEMADRLAAEHETLKEQRGALAAARSDVEAAEQTLKEADAAVVQNREDVAAAQRAARRAILLAERSRKQTQLQQLKENLAAAEAAQKDIDNAQAALRDIAVDAGMLKTLRDLDRTLRELTIKQEAVATKITLRPKQDNQATLDGAPLDPAMPVLLSQPAVLDLEGYGTIDVQPGGDDVSALSRATHAAAQDYDAALKAAACSTIDEAAAALDTKTALRNEIDRLTAVRDGKTDGAIDTLRSRIAEIEDSLQQGEAEPQTGDEETGDRASLPLSDPAALESESRCRQQVLVQAEATRDQARQDRDRARDAHTSLQARIDQMAAQRTDQEARLNDERARLPDDALAAAAQSAEAALAERTAVVSQLRADYERLSPEDARLTLKRAKETLKATRNRVDETAKRILELEAELRGAGQRGLGEEAAELDARLADLQRRHQEFAAEAAALDLLHTVLTEEERSAKDAFIGPVKARIAPYLKRVFPDAELALDTNDLSVTGLSRDGAIEPFGSLSIGTREQIAVLVRLAMADFLLEKGRPVTVILDDTLVYSDDGRFERMQNALTKAAETLQIIILTCRERDYHDLGAPIFRLQDCAIPVGDQ